jgi:hypothetical protein
LPEIFKRLGSSPFAMEILEVDAEVVGGHRAVVGVKMSEKL